MPHVVGAMLALAAFAPLGAGTLLLCNAWRIAGGILRATLTVFVGLAAAAVILPPLVYLDVSPTLSLVLLFGAVALAGGIVLDRRRTPRPQRSAQLDLIGMAAIAVPVVLLAVDSFRDRVFAYDAIADWMFKAKLLYLNQPSRFAHPSILPPVHREYPIGLPALEAVVLHGARGDFGAAQLLYATLLAGLALTIWCVLRPHVPPLVLAAGVSVVLWMPASRSAVNDYADVPLACCFVAGALLLGAWLADDAPGTLPLGAVFLAAALSMKRDAIAACVVLAVAAVAGAVVRQRSLRKLAIALASIALSAVPWRIFLAVHHLHETDVGSSRLGANANQFGWVIGTLGRYLLRREYLGVVPLAAVAALVVLLRGGPRLIAAGALALGLALLASLVFVYLNATAGVRYLVYTSGQRTLIPMVVLAAALLPLLVARALRPRP
jgi:hypothetical protein